MPPGPVAGNGAEEKTRNPLLATTTLIDGNTHYASGDLTQSRQSTAACTQPVGQ